MRDIQEIKARLEYEKKVVIEHLDCTYGTNGHERLKIAMYTVSILNWVLDSR